MLKNNKEAAIILEDGERTLNLKVGKNKETKKSQRGKKKAKHLKVCIRIPWGKKCVQYRNSD